MNVVVALNDGSQIYPSYPSENAKAIIDFYYDAIENSKIAGFIARMDDGYVYTAGQVL